MIGIEGNSKNTSADVPNLSGLARGKTNDQSIDNESLPALPGKKEPFDDFGSFEGDMGSARSHFPHNGSQDGGISMRQT